MLESFKRKCIDDRDFIIAVDEKYGPLTTKRRGMALQLRKQLKQEGVIMSGYIKFPAKLVFNKVGDIARGTNVYKVLTDFSKRAV